MFTDELTGTKAKPFPRSNRKLYLTYSMQAFVDRLGCQRGSLHLMEILHTITAKVANHPEITRDSYNVLSSTNRGDCLGPVIWEKWADSWMLKNEDKKKVFGAANRILVGGSTDSSETARPRGHNDTEPVFYHSLPESYYARLLSDHPLIGGIDLTPGPGNNALAHVKARKPYLGVCFNMHHVEMLYDHLNSMAFKAMMNEGDPLYNPSLGELLSAETSVPHEKTKKRKGIPAGHSEKDKKQKKPEGTDPPAGKASKTKTRKELMTLLSNLTGAGAGGTNDEEGKTLGAKGGKDGNDDLPGVNGSEDGSDSSDSNSGDGA